MPHDSIGSLDRSLLEPDPDDDDDHIPALEDVGSANIYRDPLAMFQSLGMGQPGHVPMPELLSVNQVRSQRNERVAKIFKNHRILTNILVRHEATIHKRWLKKTKEQKRKILLAAWGDDMAAKHRPDFEAFRKLGPRINDTHFASKYRQEFMWPFINEEDLTMPKTLLLLLNARGRHPPSDFAGADFEAMHLGIVTFAINRVFLNEHVMLFTGRHDESRYGELMNWDDHPDAFDWLHTRRHMQPAEGLLILESQDRILDFLVKCATTILHDIPANSLREYPIVHEPCSTFEQEGDMVSLATLAAEAPYRVPRHLNFGRIEALLAAKRDSAADHLWSLREDPSYFSSLMLESGEHKQEMILDEQSRKHPCLRLGREDLFWGRTINGEIIRSMAELETWAVLYEYASELKTLQKKYQSIIDPEHDLPEDYLYSLLRFRYTLEKFAKFSQSLLKTSFIASMPWRAFFERIGSDDPLSTRMSVGSSPHRKLPRSADYLLYLARTLWEDDRALFLLRLTNVVDELQRYISKEPEAKDMITPYVAAQIGDLSIIGECLRQLDNYQPWANMYEQFMLDRSEKIEEEFNLLQARWAPLVNATRKSDDVLARYGTPTDKRFYYPVEKRRNKEHTEAMRMAERNLDAFWFKVDELIHRNAGTLEGTFTHEFLLQPRLLQRTPPWTDPVAGTEKQKFTSPELHQPLSEIYFDLERRTERTIERHAKNAPKIRPKTRGVAVPIQVNANDIVAEDTHPEGPGCLISVDQRSLKVFKTLFYTPSPGATPGEVPWTDFLHAMCAVGFHAEKLYGSAWTFRPTELESKRPIMFHEPHPAGKIPYRIARRFGKRLGRRYGWHGGTFVLAE